MFVNVERACNCENPGYLSTCFAHPTSRWPGRKHFAPNGLSGEDIALNSITFSTNADEEIKTNAHDCPVNCECARLLVLVAYEKLLAV